MNSINWLLSTVGKRGYIAEYLRAASPSNSRIVGTGNDIHTIGFMACDRAYQVSSIDAVGYADELLQICLSERITAMLTLSDIDVRVLSQSRDRFVSEGIACFFPPILAADTFGDKWKTFLELEKLGFSTPRTWNSCEDALNSNPEYPLVVKPRNGSASEGVRKVNNPDELIEAWLRSEEPVVQEYVEGRLVNVEVCSDMNGQPLTGTVWDRLSSIAGETGLARTIDMPEALALITALLKQIPVPGPIDVDLIDTGEKLFILEVNTRFGGGYPVSQLAGADFPGAMGESLEGKKPRRFDRYRRDVVMMKALTPLEYKPQLSELGDVSNVHAIVRGT